MSVFGETCEVLLPFFLSDIRGASVVFVVSDVEQLHNSVTICHLHLSEDFAPQELSFNVTRGENAPIFIACVTPVWLTEFVLFG